MARSETAAYLAERKKYVTQPVAFVRWLYVPQSGSATEYAFAKDYASGAVLSASRSKLAVIRRIDGNTQSVDPLAGRSEIGVARFELVDVGRQVLRQVADPALPLKTPIEAAGVPMFGRRGFPATEVLTTGVLTVDVEGDVSGYPETGHLTIGTDDVSYRAWTQVDATTGRFYGVKAGQRGTTPASHAVSALVRNGEQLRRGTRLSLFLGYAPLAEADYGPGPGYVRLEVTGLTSADRGLTWIVEAADVRRFARKAIFENATPAKPFEIGPDHPITIALKILTSTGAGTNGAYDILGTADAIGMPQQLVDVAGLEALRTELGSLQMQFKEIEAHDGKQWIEEQIFRAVNCVPVVTQDGKYSARRLRTPEFARSGVPAWRTWRAA